MLDICTSVPPCSQDSDKFPWCRPHLPLLHISGGVLPTTRPREPIKIITAIVNALLQNLEHFS